MYPDALVLGNFHRGAVSYRPDDRTGFTEGGYSKPGRAPSREFWIRHTKTAQIQFGSS